MTYLARMNIGIIGAGHIGSTTARLFVDPGHEVAIANSRGPETLRELIEQLGSHARAATPADAAAATMTTRSAWCRG